MQVVEEVPQAVLETALPRVGGRGKVVRGQQKGTEGEVVQRDGNSERISLRSFADGKIYTLPFDDVAEFRQQG